MANLQILLVDVCATRCAIRRSAVREILPLPNLWQPPALPRPVAGFFSLGGTAVAVVRLDLLFGLADGKKAEPPGLYGHLILVRGSKAGQPMAFLVERVVDLAEIDDRELCPSLRLERSTAASKPKSIQRGVLSISCRSRKYYLPKNSRRSPPLRSKRRNAWANGK